MLRNLTLIQRIYLSFGALLVMLVFGAALIFG